MFKYIGKTYKNCSPSGAQQQALATDQSWQKTLQDSYGTIFGAGSKIFNTLSSKLNSIINTTQGFTPEELAAKNAQTINTAAANAKAVNQAIGERAAVSGGGVSPGVESGVVQAERAGAETAILSNMSNQQAKITEENYDVGRQERDRAIASSAALPGQAFGPAISAGGGVTTANEVTANQANQNAATSNQWVGLVGGLANAAVSGLTSGGISSFKPKSTGTPSS
jgi:hypothetical protein